MIQMVFVLVDKMMYLVIPCSGKCILVVVLRYAPGGFNGVLSNGRHISLCLFLYRFGDRDLDRYGRRILVHLVIVITCQMVIRLVFNDLKIILILIQILLRIDCIATQQNQQKNMVLI